MQKAILDRTYALGLIDMVRGLEDQHTAIASNLPQNPYYHHVRKLISQALILYDRILIERTYASALEKFLLQDKNNWFWEIFEPFDALELDAGVYGNYILNEDLKADLSDEDFIEVARTYYSDRNTTVDDHRSLIRYVHIMLSAAKVTESDLIVWPEKYQLFEYKFQQCRPIFDHQATATVLETICEIRLPFLKWDTFGELISLRQRDEVTALRRLVHDFKDRLFHDDNERIDKNDVVMEFLQYQDEIIQRMTTPIHTDIFTLIASSLLPFPFSTVFDVAQKIWEKAELHDYRWYFLLPPQESAVKEQSGGQDQC